LEIVKGDFNESMILNEFANESLTLFNEPTLLVC